MLKYFGYLILFSLILCCEYFIVMVDIMYFLVCIRSNGVRDLNVIVLVYEFIGLEFDLNFFFYKIDIIIEGINGGIDVNLGVNLIIVWI